MNIQDNDNTAFPKLNLPPRELRLIRDKDNIKVFDNLRKKYVALTPEEYVRQHFTGWLSDCLHYPPSLMANEIGIELNGTKKRCDSVVFNPDGTPLMIIEYKAPSIEITQAVFDQIVRYNMVLKARYLTVSNGLKHYCCVIDYLRGSYNFIPTVPDYLDIKFRPSEN